jgi:chromosome segregation ATPase
MSVENAKLAKELAKWKRETEDKELLATELHTLKERQGLDSDQANLNTIAEKDARIQELEEVVNRLSNTDRDTSGDRSEDSEALAAARLRIAELEGERTEGGDADSWLAEKAALMRQVEELQQKLDAELSEGREQKKAQDEELAREKEKLDEEKRALDEERERLEKEKDETQAERERLQEERDDVTHERERLRTERVESSPEAARSESVQETTDASSAEDATEGPHDELRDENERLRGELRQREEDLARKRDEREKMREQIVRLKSKARELVKKAREERDRLDKALRKAEEEQTRLSAERQQLSDDLAATQARLAEIERKQAQSQDEMETVMSREREHFRNSLKEVNERHDKSLSDKDEALRKLREEKDVRGRLLVSSTCAFSVLTDLPLQELITKANAAAEEKLHTDETLSKLQVRSSRELDSPLGVGADLYSSHRPLLPHTGDNDAEGHTVQGGQGQ